MIVDVARYEDGQRQEVEDLEKALEACRQEPEGFLWVGLKDPTGEEFDEVASSLHLHRLAVEDAVEGHQRPKVERYGDSLFVVLKTLAYYDDRSAVETGEIMVFVGQHFVVTVRRGEAGALGEVRELVQKDEHKLRMGPRAVLHAIMEHVVDGYTKIDGELEHDVEEMEEQVFSPSRSSDAQSIYNLKREVLEVRRAAAPLVTPLKQLLDRDRERDHERDEHPGEDGRPAPTEEQRNHEQQVMFVLRDVLDNLTRTVEHVDSYDRLLSDILNAHLAQVSVRQNDDMRKISAWAAIAAVPTLIAGVYGMNFKNMPELSWRFGYPICVLVMVGACVGLYRQFKRVGWL